MAEKNVSTLSLFQTLAPKNHSDILYTSGVVFEKTKNYLEYAAATNTGLFTYLIKNEELELVSSILWEDLIEIKADYYIFDTRLILNGQSFLLHLNGKNIFKLATEKSDAKVEIVDRKWHQKILGFRSNKKWKQITAVIVFVMIFSLIRSIFTGEEQVAVVAEDVSTEEVAAFEKVLSTDEEAKAKEEARKIAEEQQRIADEEQQKAEEEALKAAEEAVAQEQALKEEKEEKEAAELASFEALRIELTDPNGALVDMSIKRDSGNYDVRLFVDEITWASSTESEKMSFLTSMSTIIENNIDDTIFYDVYSSANLDVVATSGIFKKWKIKR